jgi:hypothetical protein
MKKSSWSAEKRSISFFSALCALPVADGVRARAFERTTASANRANIECKSFTSVRGSLRSQLLSPIFECSFFLPHYKTHHAIKYNLQGLEQKRAKLVHS